MIHQRLRILRHLSAGIRPFRPAGLADASVVETKHAITRRQEIRHLPEPGREVVGKAVDEDDRLRTVAFDLIIDVDCIDLDHGHRELLSGKFDSADHFTASRRGPIRPWGRITRTRTTIARLIAPWYGKAAGGR